MKRAAYLLIQRLATCSMGTGLRCSRLVRPSLTATTRSASVRTPRCFMTPNRLIRSSKASHTSPTVRPSRVEQQVEDLAPRGVGERLEDGVLGVHATIYVTIWSHVKSVDDHEVALVGDLAAPEDRLGQPPQLGLAARAAHQRDRLLRVRPAPVDQLPSTSTSRPPGASSPTQRRSAAAGAGRPTARGGTAPRRTPPAASGGAAASPSTKWRRRPALARGQARPSRGRSRRPSTAYPSSASSSARVPVPQPRSATRAGPAAGAEQQLAPGGPHPGVAQAVVGRLVEGRGLGVPQFDRVAHGASQSRPPTPPSRGAAVTSRPEFYRGRMITALHTLVYADDPDAARAFFRDVPAAAGGGHRRRRGSIFRTGPQRARCPSGRRGRAWRRYRAAPTQSLRRCPCMCDDLDRDDGRAGRARRRRSSGDGGRRSGWGSTVQLVVPGAGTMTLYQPTYRAARPSMEDIQPMWSVSAPPRRRSSRGPRGPGGRPGRCRSRTGGSAGRCASARGCAPTSHRCARR